MSLFDRYITLQITEFMKDFHSCINSSEWFSNNQLKNLMQCSAFCNTLYFCLTKLLATQKETQLTKLWLLCKCQPQVPQVLKVFYPHQRTVLLAVLLVETQALPHLMSGAMGHTGTGPLLFCSDITSEILLHLVLPNYQRSCVNVGH